MIRVYGYRAPLNPLTQEQHTQQGEMFVASQTSLWVGQLKSTAKVI